MSTATLVAPWSCRAVYLWAGTATIDLLHEKMPDVAVDEEAHRNAYTQASAAELRRIGINLAFVSMNWGFPPESESRHWAEFASAVQAFRDAGLQVVGYVQASNCVATGSYAKRDWYARTPTGRRVSYYRRRLMTCWNSAEWLAEVESHALRVIDAGGAGVFFDNCWVGATPWTLGGRVGGFAGCACARCAAAFREAHGSAIPRALGDDELSSTYLRWRAEVHARRLSAWADAVRRRNPHSLVLINNCDVVLRDSLSLFGLDLRAAATSQSALLVENVAMPRHEPRQRRLVTNAVVVKAVRATAPERPVLALPYEHGIGLDARPSATRVCRTIAEALASGAAPVVKGAEYLDSSGRMTVVTADDFAPYRQALAPLLNWAAANESLFRDAQPDAEVAVYYDMDGMATRWTATAPATFAVAMALVDRAVPFRFVATVDDVLGDSSLRRVLVPPNIRAPEWNLPLGPRLMPIPVEILDIPAAFSPRLGRPLTRWLLNAPMTLLARAYFGCAPVRRLIDGTGLAANFLQSSLFRIPRKSRVIEALLPALRQPRARCDQPILVERWRHRDGRRLLHLVNYADRPVAVRFASWHPEPVSLHTPDTGTHLSNDDEGHLLNLECYAVLEHRLP